MITKVFKKRCVSTMVVLTVLLAGPGPSVSRDVLTVRAEGTHEVSELTGEVKRLALDDALRRAVREALATFMTEESIDSYSGIFESTIFANMEDYILNYRITAEGTINHMDSPATDGEPDAAPGVLKLYHIWIEASIDLKKLKKDVKSMTTIGEEEVSIVTIILLGVGDFKTFDGLKSAIESMEKVRDISYSSFYRGRVVMEARVAGRAELFWEDLTALLGERFAVIPGGSDRIIIKAGSRE